METSGWLSFDSTPFIVFRCLHVVDNKTLFLGRMIPKKTHFISIDFSRVLHRFYLLSYLQGKTANGC